MGLKVGFSGLRSGEGNGDREGLRWLLGGGGVLKVGLVGKGGGL